MAILCDKGYPIGVDGAVMIDKDGCEVFVPTEHDKNAVKQRTKLGWRVVEFRKAKESPTEPVEE